MGLQDTDNFLVERGLINYRMAASLLKDAQTSPVITSPTTPVVFDTGTLWLNTATNKLSVWDGTAWQFIIRSTAINWARPAGVPRTVDNKVRERVSVKDFGAVGNGVVDDTAAIQNAINTIGPWKKLYFPTGTYIISTQLTLPNDGNGNAGMVFEGDGFGSILQSNAANNIFYIDSLKFITFRNLTFRKLTSLNTGYAIHLFVPSATNNGTLGGNLEVKFCRFENWNVAIGTSAPNCNISNNVITNCRIGFESYGFGHNLFIRNNRITGVNPSSIGLLLGYNDQPVDSYPDNVFIISNEIEFASTALNSTPLIIRGGKNHFILYNSFLNRGACTLTNVATSPAMNAVIGITLGGSFPTPYCRTIRITNNTILSARANSSSDFGGIGINVLGTPSNIFDVLIEGNSFYTADGSGRAVHLVNINGYKLVQNNISGTRSGDDIGIGFTVDNIEITNSTNGTFINNTDRYTTGRKFEIDSYSDPTLVSNNIRASSGGNYFNGDYNELVNTSSNDATLIVSNSNSTGFDANPILNLRIPNDLGRNNNLFLLGADATRTNYYVTGDGSVYNVNGVYSAISDATLKKNISDCNSQLTEVKRINLYNYTLTEDSTNTKHLGVLAQEAEKVNKMLVSNQKVKSVNYSLLFLKAVGALKEVMKTIEELEFKIKLIRKDK